MEHHSSQFFKSLSSCQTAVGYIPLKNEVDSAEILPIALPLRFTIPSARTVDPFETARQVSALFSDARVCVYIPGSAFDVEGVRHGRGGGWYDRFLSVVPTQWVRVGFCHENQCSFTSLPREQWDELVDWVCVKKINETQYYKTNARSIY